MGEIAQAKQMCDACKKRQAARNEPEGYLAWHEWADRMAKRYDQEQCPDCGRWTIFRRKPAGGSEDKER